MFTRGMLERYAESVKSKKTREVLHGAISEILFEVEGGVERCASRQAQEAFEQADLAHLYKKFAANDFLRFLDPAEMKGLAGDRENERDRPTGIILN